MKCTLIHSLIAKGTFLIRLFLKMSFAIIKCFPVKFSLANNQGLKPPPALTPSLWLYSFQNIHTFISLYTFSHPLLTVHKWCAAATTLLGPSTLPISELWQHFCFNLNLPCNLNNGSHFSVVTCSVVDSDDGECKCTRTVAKVQK